MPEISCQPGAELAAGLCTINHQCSLRLNPDCAAPVTRTVIATAGPVIDGQPVGEGAIPTNELQNGPTLHPGLPAGSSLADAAATEAIDIPSVMPNSTANGIPACLPPQPPPQSLIQPPPQPSLQSPLQQAPAAALEHAPSVQHAPSPQQVAPSPVHYYAHGGPLRGAATAQPDGSYQWRMPQSSSIRLHLPKAVASAWRVQDRAVNMPPPLVCATMHAQCMHAHRFSVHDTSVPATVEDDAYCLCFIGLRSLPHDTFDAMYCAMMSLLITLQFSISHR